MKVGSAEARRKDIVEKVKQQGFVSVDNLAKAFDTSEVTIRKDLATLSSRGVILRQMGGAVPMPLGVVSTDAAPAKSHLGEAAASLVSDNQKLIIDCGSTTAALVPFLHRFSSLIVMTNALSVANVLTASDAEPTVLMTGGTWDANSQSFQGTMAEKLVSAYNYDVAFIGASGIDVERGTTTLNELTGLTRAMADAATTVVIMAESSKVKNKMPNVELSWDKVSVLITDDQLSDAHRKIIEQHGVEVITAASKGV